jgi:hypothetical protein
MNRLVSEAGTQTLDQLRYTRARLAVIHGEKLRGSFPRHHQRTASQPEPAHRRR